MDKSHSDLHLIVNSARALAENSGIAAAQRAVGGMNLGWINQVSSAKSLSRVLDAAKHLNLRPIPELKNVYSARALYDLFASRDVGVHSYTNLLQSSPLNSAFAITENLRLGEIQRLLGSPSIKALTETIQPFQQALSQQIQKQLKESDYTEILKAVKSAKRNEVSSVEQNETKYGEHISQQENESITNFETELLSKINLDSELIESIHDLGRAAASNDDGFLLEAVNDLVYGLPDVSKRKITYSLLEYYRNLPPYAKRVFEFLFGTVLGGLLLAIVIDVNKERLKPIIDTYVCKNPYATVRVVGFLVCTATNGEIQNTRLVKGSFLNVRKTPNAKGEVLDILPQFEPVTLITKSKDLSWSLIRYKNEDNEVMEGWVFSRYLHKPKS